MHLLSLLLLLAIAYQILALAAGGLHLLRQYNRRAAISEPPFTPPVSVLKPVHGMDPEMYSAFVSQAKQDYPEFEILFGIRDPQDPAVDCVERLRAEFPEVPIRLIVASTFTHNRKVGVLLELAKEARHPVWVVNDSDIRVSSNYLRETVAPLRDPQVGVVTCPYRPRAHAVPSMWEALGIATDFMPSTLVAPLVGVREFGLGSTLVFRRDDLLAAGGFVAFSHYIADDYQLARHITGLGKRAVLSSHVVETSLGDTTWSGAWDHQLRWARTIRLTKGRGYLGLPITQAGIWILLALLAANWPAAAILLALRVSSALLTGGLVLRSRVAISLCWLTPLWDLYAFAVWLSSYRSRIVRWRDRTLELDPIGRIVS